MGNSLIMQNDGGAKKPVTQRRPADVIVSVAIVFFFLMFIVSGVQKIGSFKGIVDGLTKKLGNVKTLAQIGLVLVILLEIVGSLYMVGYHTVMPYVQTSPEARRDTTIISMVIVSLFIAFMIAVIPLYHQPAKDQTGFFQKITTIGALLIMMSISVQRL